MEFEKYSRLNIIAAISISALVYLGNFVSPVISLISKEYSGIPESMIKMLATIPYLMMGVTSLISGNLTNYFTIKKIVLFASAFSLIGGMMPVMFNGIIVLTVSRFVFGIGYGLIFPMALAIINQLFNGCERDRLMGIRAGVGALTGACYSVIAGGVGMINWRYAFSCTLIVIPIALFIAWKCPDNELVGSPVNQGATCREKKLTALTYLIYVGLFLLNMLMITFMTDLSLVISTDNIGTAAQAGFISFVCTIAAFVAGVIFAHVKKKWKRYTSVIAFGFISAGFAILFLAQTLPMLCMGAGVYGLGFGIYNSQITMVVAQTATKPVYAPLAIAGYTSCVGIGQFLSSILLPPLAKYFCITGNRSDWFLSCIGCSVAVIISGAYIMLTGGAERKGNTYKT